MGMVKLVVRRHPEDPFGHDRKLEQLFIAVKWASDLWLHPSKRPPLPDWCQCEDDTAFLEMEDNLVKYTTMSGAGVYEFRSDGFSFQGAWRSLLDGCPLCRIKPIGPSAPLHENGLRYAAEQPRVTPKNTERADISVFAPIGLYRLQVFYGEFDYPEFSVEYEGGRRK